MKVIKAETYREVPRDFTGIVIIDFDESRTWYVDGKWHREDGPARIWPDDHKEWWFNNAMHREDGPAKEWPSGVKEWFLHGKCVFSEEEWFESNFNWLGYSIDEQSSLFIEEIVKVIEPIKKFHFIFGKYLCSEGIFYKGIRWEPVP